MKSVAKNANDERDAKVFALYEQLVEIEQRLIPTGLHVFGRASSAGEKIDLLKMIASFDRPEAGVRALPEDLVDEAVREFVGAGTDAAVRFLEQKGLIPAETRPVFVLLETVSTKLQTNNELDSLVRALRGEFIEPGPGADIIQNPDILPTGRNTHAINPYGVPSAAAFARSEAVANSLLSRYKHENGRYPEAMALVLWGLDNIKTQGEGVAQALWLLGTRPVRDALNRTTNVEAIPLAQLDEPLELNYVRKHVLQQVEHDACDLDEAAVRVFSNAPGNYGTNVNFMVMDSQWEREETLGDLFVTRKCFAYGRDSKGLAIEGREARVAMDRALARVEATYQNIDTFEIGLTDVDHYFEYLGGVSKAVEKRAKARPAIYLSDSLSRDVKIRTLEETVRLETRAKTLNPKWYEGMLKHGFRGVAEIENHVSNTFGWSATADAVDDWIYSEVANTFLFDESMLERLRDLNPHSAHSLVQRLLEANGRGYWDVEDSVLEKLRDISRSLEDQLEGVA